jgi:hypothetical protein
MAFTRQRIFHCLQSVAERPESFVSGVSSRSTAGLLVLVCNFSQTTPDSAVPLFFILKYITAGKLAYLAVAVRRLSLSGMAPSGETVVVFSLCSEVITFCGHPFCRTVNAHPGLRKSAQHLVILSRFPHSPHMVGNLNLSGQEVVCCILAGRIVLV